MSLYQKIKELFNSIFEKKDKQLYIAGDNKNVNNAKNNFIENVKNTENEDTKLLNLQKSLKNGTIKISDLTLSEINNLNKLYVSQNEILKKKIENHKNRILKLKQQAG